MSDYNYQPPAPPAPPGRFARITAWIKSNPVLSAAIGVLIVGFMIASSMTAPEDEATSPDPLSGVAVTAPPTTAPAKATTTTEAAPVRVSTFSFPETEQVIAGHLLVDDYAAFIEMTGEMRNLFETICVSLDNGGDPLVMHGRFTAFVGDLLPILNGIDRQVPGFSRVFLGELGVGMSETCVDHTADLLVVVGG